MRLRGRAALRNARAETALALAATHLAQTLAEPPARFHDRLFAARRRAFLRRGIPTLTAITLLLTLAALAHLDGDRAPGLWMALYHVPTFLVALSFCLQELPRFGIPPWPRRLAEAAWRSGALRGCKRNLLYRQSGCEDTRLSQPDPCRRGPV